MSGKRFLKVKVVELNVIGTDPNQAINFFQRHAVTPEPTVKGRGTNPYESVWYGSDWVKAGYPGESWSATISGATGLYQITSFIRSRKYQELGLPGLTRYPGPERKKADDDPARKKKRLEYDRYRSVAPELDFGDPAAILSGQNMDQVHCRQSRLQAAPLVRDLGGPALPPQQLGSQPLSDAPARESPLREVLPGIDPV